MTPEDIWYTALFVASPEELLKHFPPKHEQIWAHHSTIAFEPGNLNNIEIGKHHQVKILGRVTDDKGDALLVENPKSKMKYPHITISCKPEVGPIYSNELLAKAAENGTINYFPETLYVGTIEGYGSHDGEVHLK